MFFRMKTACQDEYTDVLRYGRKFIYNRMRILSAIRNAKLSDN